MGFEILLRVVALYIVSIRRGWVRGALGLRLSRFPGWMHSSCAEASTVLDVVQQGPTFHAVSIPFGQATMNPSWSDLACQPEMLSWMVLFSRMP